MWTIWHRYDKFLDIYSRRKKDPTVVVNSDINRFNLEVHKKLKKVTKRGSDVQNHNTIS